LSSLRLSADGLFYWDGKQWVSALSPDGRHRWDGSSWIPIPTAQAYAPQPAFIPMPAVPPAPKAARVPTTWTRPLQNAVAGWWVIQTVWYLALPLWLTGSLNQYITKAADQMAQQSPQVYQASSLQATMWVLLTISFVIGAVVGLAFAITIVVGAMRLWSWVYYGVLALLGLQILGLPLNIAYSLGLTASTFVPPALLYWVASAASIVSIALFAWMLVALLRRGPWAMRRALTAQ
jgi:hypothetical protein